MGVSATAAAVVVATDIYSSVGCVRYNGYNTGQLHCIATLPSCRAKWSALRRAAMQRSDDVRFENKKKREPKKKNAPPPEMPYLGLPKTCFLVKKESLSVL